MPLILFLQIWSTQGFEGHFYKANKGIKKKNKTYKINIKPIFLFITGKKASILSQQGLVFSYAEPHSCFSLYFHK